MEARTIGDPEFVLLVEEEKRLCEKNVQFIRGILKKNISLKNDDTIKKDTEVAAIKLDRKLENKELYKNTKIDSGWKMINKDTGKLYAFLDMTFPITNAPKLRFCFEMNAILLKAGEEEKFRYKGLEATAIPMRFEKETDTILQWMTLLIKSNGNLSIIDGEEPSIGTDGIPLDVPDLILSYFDDIIKEGGVHNKPMILVRDKEGLGNG